MKIAVISDTHLGYASGTEREDDAFNQAEEAMDKAISMDVDLILLPGDIFNGKIPNPEIFSRALKILKKPLMHNDKDVEILEPDVENEKISESGIPVVAIHGTHERRSKGYVNPIEMLEDAGYLIHLNCEKAVVKVNGDKVAIHGMSGVPEEYAKTVLSKYDPESVEGTPNIFMLHQSLKEYVYDKDNTFLEVGELPDGFDLYIDGHIHWRNELNDGKDVLFPGSTVMTQMRKIEAEKDKGFYVVDTDNWAKEFISLKTRPFEYLELELDGESSSEVIERAREKIRNNLEDSSKKPLIKLKLKGEVSETEAIHIDKNEIKEGFNALIDIDEEFKGKGLKMQIDNLRKAQEEKKSIKDMGIDNIKKMLGETDYNSIEPEKMISLLSEKDLMQIVERIDKNYDEWKPKKDKEENSPEESKSKLSDWS